ncbi:LysR family transcriptional regulator [Rhizobium changzhiense]|uniref:LysR family transcriptional regulator n=1 Tax=Rhizobium changzhiense TaxID=2692317 RepID=A0ABR6AF61_9HYPH|nr:LysR family transcriptional regulator [Rhizobium changzhiense]MBA5805282.1 LysR family transcriptional regulator [Rhizobium changzhiense]
MHEIDLRRVDLNLLVVFETVMRERHVGRSGEALGLTQPAVSHALSRLRQLLGDPLFIRHAGGVRPTPRAEALNGPITHALTAVRAALAETGAFNPGHAVRTVSIGGSDYTDLVLMPALMAEMRISAPGFDIRRRPTSREAVMGDLRRRDIDLAIGPLAAAPDALVLTPLFTERLVLVARKGHPALAADMSLNMLAALDHLLVSTGGDATGSLDERLRDAGLSRRVVMTLPNFLAAPFIVAATDLVTLLAERVAQRLADAAAIAIHPQAPPLPSWTIGLARLAGTAPDPATDWFADAAAKVAATI